MTQMVFAIRDTACNSSFTGGPCVSPEAQRQTRESQNRRWDQNETRLSFIPQVPD